MQQNANFLVYNTFACFLCLVSFGSAAGYARATPHSNINPCDAAAEKAAGTSGVPIHILRAISRVETGRSVGGVLTPWPWAVNQAGSGSFFTSKSDAIDHVAHAMASGQSNIDVGCFQINIRWHGAEFASLNAMFDPTENAAYAARYLLTLYAEFGSWDDAIGAYHSRQNGAATAYLAKVSALVDTLPAAPAPAVITQPSSRENLYPFLRTGRASRYGSLVSTTSDRPAVPLFQ